MESDILFNIKLIESEAPLFPTFRFSLCSDRRGTTQCRPPVSQEVGRPDAVQTDGAVRRLEGQRMWIVGGCLRQSQKASRLNLRRRRRPAPVERAGQVAVQFAIDVRMVRLVLGHVPTAGESSVTAQPLGTNI